VRRGRGREERGEQDGGDGDDRSPEAARWDDLEHGEHRPIIEAGARGDSHEIRTMGGSIAAMPHAHVNLRQDVADVGSNFDGDPGLEFRLATAALGLEQSGLCFQHVPAGYRFPYGHTHDRQEEVYVVVGGSGRMKLDDEVVELARWDAVRVPPGTWRGYEAGADGLDLLVLGAPNLGDDPRGDVTGERDWWTDD
jgi:mannose-6-phosphate isomerase-like protein (cupin superfamily)